MARRRGATGKAKEAKETSTIFDGLDFDFSGSPTIWRFLHDNSFFRGIMGPVGSGKSFACAAEVFLRAVKQTPTASDNIRYTRFAVIRNSYPELRTTTIKTWNSIFPENIFGPMRWSPPLSHHIRLPPRGNAAGIDCEVIFLALDQPKDVRKLLSLELTGAWINEAREIPLGVVQGLTHRVGRYPSKIHGGPDWRGIWADTNPMGNDSWWYRLAEKEPIKGRYKWTFFKQPGAMIRTDRADEGIPAAGKYWRPGENVENIQNLPIGYYEQQLGGKSLDWIECYVGGNYVYVQEGLPIWPEYDDTIMATDNLIPDKDLPIQVGLDFGLTPAAVIGQRFPTGVWHVLNEIVTEDMGLERFGLMLLHVLNTQYPGYEIKCWGDPSGTKRDEIFEVTSFDHLRSIGLTAYPTASNAFRVRREAGALPMTRLFRGRPSLLVADTCKKLRRALAGGYHFKGAATDALDGRRRDLPYKNDSSHVGDAFGYLMLGGGEHRVLTRPPGMQQHEPLIIADHDFRVI